MHPLLAAFGGGHGHSHATGGSCHGHSHDGSSGHSHMQLSEEERAAMLKQLEAQMMMMSAGQGAVLHPGHVHHDPNNPGPGSYNRIIFGYGHDGGSPPEGWGSLAPSVPPEPASNGPVSFDDMLMMHMGPLQRDRYWLINVPVIGRLRIVKDRPGIMQALGVILYWLYGNWSTWFAILLPYYADGAISLPLMLC